MRQQILADSAAQAFVMLNARRYEPGADPVEDEGYYDPITQTWVGRISAQGRTFSDRSTSGGSSGRDVTNTRDD